MEKKNKKKKPVIDINQILETYRKNEDILVGDTDEMMRIKDVIYNELSETEKRIILLYAELGNQRDVAAALGVSLFVANREIRKIRAKIISSVYGDNH